MIVDPDLAVASAAVEALGQIGSEQAAGILQSLVDDPDFEALQETVAEALEEMSWLSGDVDFDWFDMDELDEE